MLKCQFHCHVKGDPEDNIRHSAKELIKKAAKENYDVVAITSHRKIIFNKNLKKYAEKKGILLLPGIEFEIDKQHILAINAEKSAEEIKTFEDLKIYKEKNPQTIIIAPHPFFPGKCTLKNNLIKNINLFDAIEQSYFYSKKKDYNKEAIALAKRWKKPIIATSDCHILKHFDISYALIDANKDEKSIKKSILQNKIENYSKPQNIFKLGLIYLKMLIRN